jgi:peptide/nickel transport system substrate-binding protein
MWVERQVTESLAWRDPYTLEYVPLLASGWEISEDGLTMRFQLRRGVTFSDGEPFDADDVIYSFDLVRNPVVAADRTRSYLTKLKDVKKIDPYTVEFTFTEPYFLNFGSVAENVPVLPQHFYSRFTADQFNEKTGLLMGTGPYRLENPESWTPGQLVALLRNDRYWGVPAAFNRIIFHEIQEEAPQMVLYGNKEHDVIRCTPDQYIQLTNDERVMKFSNKYSYQTPFKGYIYVGWNQLRRQGSAESKTFFADKRVRQAMTMLLDRERMNREIFHGYYSVASGPFAPNGPQAAPDLQPWPHAPERAMALLNESGFADRDGNGVLENEKGEPFRFTLTYPSGSEAWEKFTLFAKDAFARAGILMVPDRVDWPVLVQRLNTSDFEAVTLGWSSVVESDPYQVFHSDSIKGQGDNRIAYRSAELDRAIDAARTTMDKEKRMKLWHEVHRILHEDQPYTFLFNRPQLTLMNSRIHNVEKSNLGLNFELLNGGVMPWFVPEKMQRYTQ